ncbi:MAG: CRTAC1 family protein [Cypionkella sp.]
MRGVAAVLILLPGAALADETPVIPKFIEETAISGIASVYAGKWEFMTGGGVAAFDCNGDGKPELFMAGGTANATLYRNDSATGGALKFTAVTSGAELDRVTGAYPLDVDGDGILDLVILRSGEDVVMQGEGNCHFHRANEAWGFNGRDLWSTAFSATWEKGQDWPTLAIGTYIDRTQDAFPWGSCTENGLYRPKGRGFDAPLALKPSYCTLSMLFTDWNRSGTPALRVSNDREYYKGGTEQMWHVDPGQPPALYTAAEGWKPLKIWGMGIASTDVNGDGLPDYFLTSMADSKLQVLAAGPGGGPLKATFKDEAFVRHAIAQRPYTGGDIHPSTGWHTEFQDVNNDGRQDLFIAKGNVSAMPDFAMKDPNNLMLGQADGSFVEVGDKAGVASFKQSRGASVVDLNGDGQMDLVVVNRNDTAQIWRNAGDGLGQAKDLGHWLQLSLHEEAPNRDAIGAWIEVRQGDAVQRREITSGGGHAGGQIGWWHFGIGTATEAEVRVIWPDGTIGGWAKVTGDGFYDLVRGKSPARH